MESKSNIIIINTTDGFYNTIESNYIYKGTFLKIRFINDLRYGIKIKLL
jgi:hypothetical protein